MWLVFAVADIFVITDLYNNAEYSFVTINRSIWFKVYAETVTITFPVLFKILLID